MKKIEFFDKLLKSLIVLLISLFIEMEFVYAEELKAIMSYSGNNTAIVGEEFNLKVIVDNKTTEPIVGLNGIVIYNKEYLELISMTGMENPYTVSVNPKNAKFIGLSFELKGITKNATILNLKFKTLKAGTTTLDLDDIDLANRKAKNIPVIVKSQEITIKEPVVIKETEISEKNAQEIKELEEISNPNINAISKPASEQKEEPKNIETSKEDLKTEVKKDNKKLENKETISESSKENNIKDNTIRNKEVKTPKNEAKKIEITKEESNSKSNQNNQKEAPKAAKQEAIIKKEIPNILSSIKSLFIKEPQEPFHLNLFSKLSELFFTIIR